MVVAGREHKHKAPPSNDHAPDIVDGLEIVELGAKNERLATQRESTTTPSPLRPEGGVRATASFNSMVRNGKTPVTVVNSNMEDHASPHIQVLAGMP